MTLPQSAACRCAMERFDAANAEDPRREADGTPKELAYARRMSEWLARLEPDAPEEVRLAVRAQHIRRWEIPRSSYPAGREAYLRWRRDLAKFHADTAGGILRECGFDEDAVERVQSVIRKQRFKADPRAQLLEDVACLVFLDHYFDAFSREQSEESMIRILQRTWIKMSDAGHRAALGIDYSPSCRRLLDLALDRG